jgi:2-polyprenyl-3-methyl-5-hydroxy-6-metoxy-1,4-benzoquinol methylase
MNRYLVPELMDDPELGAQEHEEALEGLERINRLSRVSNLIWNPIKQLSRQHRSLGHDERVSVLDIATGGGDLPIALSRMSRRDGLPIKTSACDVSARALSRAAQKAAISRENINFFKWHALEDPIPEKQDVIVNCLFLHHLEREDAIRFLKRCSKATNKLLIICDLRRSRAGYVLARVASRVLTPSRVVHFDGPQSVRAAFTVDEMITIAKEANLENVVVRRAWPFRLLLIWKKT